MKRIWQKNDSSPGTNREWFDKFTAEDDRYYDQYLIPHDILGNIAQAKMLHKIGILDGSEVRDLVSALRVYYAKWEKGEFGLTADDEDVHSAVEGHLTKDCGDSGKKIHTGRSRNDQVQTDIRMFLKEKLLFIAAQLIEVYVGLDDLRRRHADVFFAGTTHTQPAMPTSVDAWVAGYQDMLLSDLRSLRAVYVEVDRSPLGSAAGYGAAGFGLDRGLVGELLGFSEVQWSVTAVQLYRGVIEKRLVDALGFTAHTFNRMASDIINFANPVFGYVQLSDDQTSGSSIMPQKRNPDAWELIRGNYSFFTGWSAQLATISANLISGYHRDLQITKKVVMDAVFKSEELADVVKNALRGVTFDRDRCQAGLSPEVFATHEANRLTAKGLPFREAYRKAAESVKEAKILTISELKASYKSAGDPGNYPQKYLEPLKSEILVWITSETQKKESILYKLLNDDES